MMEQDEKKGLELVHFIKKRKIDLAFLLAGGVIGLYFDWNIMEILVFLIFIWAVLGSIPSRFFALPALFFLILTPVMLSLAREERAEEFAIYAYYFMVIAVVRAILEVRNEEKEA